MVTLKRKGRTHRSNEQPHGVPRSTASPYARCSRATDMSVSASWSPQLPFPTTRTYEDERSDVLTLVVGHVVVLLWYT